MRKLILAISTLAFAGSAAFADPIQERQALMKERGKIAGQLSKVVKGEAAYDAAAVLVALKALQANAEKFHANVETLFPAGSAAAAAPADVDALKAGFNTIGGDCGTCHQTYRIKKG
ncbi:MAG: cytochrome C556 [Mesorhizobium sp.]|nr:MAG: cytochrome C556 [Mesorhizobium sp.]